MKVLSLDIGWRHLGCAQLHVELDSLAIEKWEIKDILTDSSINVNTSTTEELVKESSVKLSLAIEEWTFWKPDVAYLESQPLGQMARNVKTKTLSHIIQALLIAKGIRVQFVSPKKKLAGISKETIASYSNNKKFAVVSCIELLERCKLIQWKEWFEEKNGKRDDLADALLQGYYASIEELVKKPKKVRAKSKKRARNAHDAHEITENIVYLEFDS
jgi:hypothetical protein